MAEIQIIEEVKKGLQITGEFHDDVLSIYIVEVKEYLEDAGVSSTYLNSQKSIGLIVRGVADLWNHDSGNAQLSPYFKERAAQAVYMHGE